MSWLPLIRTNSIKLKDLPFNPMWEDLPNRIKNNKSSFLDLNNYMLQHEFYTLRTDFNHYYSYAVADPQAIDMIVRTVPTLPPVIEIGAGTGYWARLLQLSGYEVSAFDHKTKDNTFVHTDFKFFPVQKGSFRQVEKQAYSTLFICWGYMNNMSYQAVKRHKGEYLIHIGEGYGGCTESDLFFEHVTQAYTEVESLRLSFWEGLHDRLTIWKRR